MSCDLDSAYHTSHSFLLVFTIHASVSEAKLPMFLWCICAFVKEASSYSFSVTSIYQDSTSHFIFGETSYFTWGPSCLCLVTWMWLRMHLLNWNCLSFSCAYPLMWCITVVSKGRIWSSLNSLTALLTSHAILGKLYTFSLWLMFLICTTRLLMVCNL